MRGTVRFGDVDGFLEDLARDRQLVDRRIVRLSFVERSLVSVPMVRVSVVVTAQVGELVYRLELACGDAFMDAEDRARIRGEARPLIERIEACCGELRFELRGGVLDAQVT